MNSKNEQNLPLAAVLNLFIWGTGYLYLKRIALGIGWLIVFALAHWAMYDLGVDFYTESPGYFILASHIGISILLAYDVVSSE